MGQGANLPKALNPRHFREHLRKLGVAASVSSLSAGAARCIFTGLSPDGSVYVTVDNGDVDVYAVDVKLP